MLLWSFHHHKMTAIFFCVLFILLVRPVVCSPAIQEIPLLNATNLLNYPRQLMIVHCHFDDAWNEALHDQGLRPTLEKEGRKVVRQERKIGVHQLSWKNMSYYGELPVSDGNAAMSCLGEKWRQVTKKMGMRFFKPQSGYTNGCFWLKLESGVVMNVDGRPVSLPLETMLARQSSHNGQKKFDWGRLFPAFSLGESKSVEVTAPEEETPPVKPTVEPGPVENTPMEKVKGEPSYHAKIAIIVDDVGNSREVMDEFLTIDAPVAWSILPFSLYGRQLAVEGKAHGFEIMLHQPLEPVDPRQDPGPGLIRRTDSPETVANQLTMNLSTVPGVCGVNNHMGSAGTSDERFMDILMQELKKKNLFFIDSYTINYSVAEKYARLYQIPTARRDFFLDNEPDFQYKVHALEEVLQYALKHGTAIAIGHARKGTGQAIKSMLPKFAAAGIQIVPVSQLVK